MTTGRAKTKAILSAVARTRERSPLYWWLAEHHDEMIEAARGGRIKWRAILDTIAAAGITNAAGGPPTAEIASDTWSQVRRDVAAGRVRPGKRPRQPSRLPATWRPQPVSVSVPPRSAAPEAPSRPPPTGPESEPVSERVRAGLAKFDALFARADRHLYPPTKRKG